MPDFLAQSYLADRGTALAAMGRARQIRSPLLLRAILVPGDEIFLTLWRGFDADAVDTAAREVGPGSRPGCSGRTATAWPGPHATGAGAAWRALLSVWACA